MLNRFEKFVRTVRFNSVIPLQAGDRIIFRTDKSGVLEIRQHLGITFDTEDMHLAEPLPFHETIIAEGTIDQHSAFIGRTPASLRLRRRYGSYILAVHRDGQNMKGDFSSLALQAGDVLLLEGERQELEKLFETERLLGHTQVQRRNYNHTKAPVAAGLLIGVMVLAACNVMPITGLAIIGAVLALLTGCITSQQANEAIDWRILLLIFGTLSLSTAMQNTGLAKMIVEVCAAWVMDWGPLAVLAVVYIITASLTQVMSNNATAVVLTPIVIGLAQNLAMDARALIIAVMFAASASFSIPISYQTNAYVYQVGNYRFRDFLPIGLSMNLLLCVTTVAAIAFFRGLL